MVMKEYSSRIGRRSLLKTLSTTGIALTAGCLTGDGGDGGTTDGGDSEGEIVIGALQPYSGPFSLYSEAHQAGLEFAINEVNENGGVLGRELSVTLSDTSAEPSEAATIYERMVEEQEIVAATGTVSSDVGIRVGQAAEKQEVPLFFHATASNEALTKDARYRFRVGALPAASAIKAVSGLVEEKEYSNVGSIIADYAWGQSIKKSINKYFPDGVNVEFGTAPVGESDFSPFLRDFSDDIELLIGTGHPPGVTDIFKQALNLGLGFEQYLGSTAPDIAYYNALGDRVTDGFTMFHQTDVYSEQFKDVAQRFADQNGDYFGTTHGVGYVTGKLIAAGLEEAGEADPVALADAMRNITFDTLYPEPIQYTEWGEMKNQRQLWSQFKLEAPDYYPDGDFTLTEAYRSDPIKAFDPETF